MIEIKLAERADLPEIVQMLLRDARLELHPQDGPSDEQIRAFDAMAEDPDNRLVVAKMHGAVVGTLQLTFVPGLSQKGMWRAQVEAVRVRDDLRNQRIGTRMMEWAIDRARERGCWMVQLTTHHTRRDAHRFYERLGFTASHIGMKLYL
jgi:GNAT superfamily N-acetyltransferase